MLTRIVVLYIAYMLELPTWCFLFVAFEMSLILTRRMFRTLDEISETEELKDEREDEEYLQDL